MLYPNDISMSIQQETRVNRYYTGLNQIVCLTGTGMAGGRKADE
jgi:hypothetical protein